MNISKNQKIVLGAGAAGLALYFLVLRKKPAPAKLTSQVMIAKTAVAAKKAAATGKGIHAISSASAASPSPTQVAGLGSLGGGSLTNDGFSAGGGRPGMGSLG